MASSLSDIQTLPAIATINCIEAYILHHTVSRRSLPYNYSMNHSSPSPLNHDNTPSLNSSFCLSTIESPTTNIQIPLDVATTDSIEASSLYLTVARRSLLVNNSKHYLFYSHHYFQFPSYMSTLQEIHNMHYTVPHIQLDLH